MEFSDVKLIQTIMLMNELDTQSFWERRVSEGRGTRHKLPGCQEYRLLCAEISTLCLIQVSWSFSWMDEYLQTIKTWWNMVMRDFWQDLVRLDLFVRACAHRSASQNSCTNSSWRRLTTDKCSILTTHATSRGSLTIFSTVQNLLNPSDYWVPSARTGWNSSRWLGVLILTFRRTTSLSCVNLSYYPSTEWACTYTDTYVHNSTIHLL